MEINWKSMEIDGNPSHERLVFRQHPMANGVHHRGHLPGALQVAQADDRRPLHRAVRRGEHLVEMAQELDEVHLRGLFGPENEAPSGFLIVFGWFSPCLAGAQRVQ